jgi:hypothetical protein
MNHFLIIAKFKKEEFFILFYELRFLGSGILPSKYLLNKQPTLFSHVDLEFFGSFINNEIQYKHTIINERYQSYEGVLGVVLGWAIWVRMGEGFWVLIWSIKQRLGA